MPITAQALVAYPICNSSSLNPEVPPNGCLFGPPFPGFEIDGNSTVDTANGVDWNTNPFPYPRTDFQLVGPTEIDLVSGSKYLDQSSWQCSLSDVSPQKVELLAGTTAINTFPNGHQVGFFNFTRQAANGDAFIDYVFSKGSPPASPTCTGLPARTPGDTVVTFTLTNGGTTVTIDLARWNGTGFDSVGSGTLGTNWITGESTDGLFFEGAIDFTNVFFNGSGGFTCHDFGSVYMDSRSSGSGGTSEMKDVSGLALPPLCKNPTIATQSSSSGGGIAAGTVVHDTATVSGVTGSGVPTGTVDFHLCGPLASASGCQTGGTDIGSVAQTSTSALANPPTATYVSPNTAPLDGVGTYCWRADYTAAQSGNYTNVSTNANQDPIDAAHECFTVVGATTTTTASSKTGNQAPGVSVTDTASVHLTAPATGGPPTGTVTFSLTDPTGTTTQIGSPVTVSGGTATSAAVDGTTTPNTNTIGTYCWTAVYTPTGNFTGSSETDKPAGECFTVIGDTTTTTASSKTGNQSAGVSVTDTATVSLNPPGVDGHPTGTVTFTLCDPSSTCTVISTNALVNGVASSSAVNGGTSPNTNAVGKYCWEATYNPTGNFTTSFDNAKPDVECFTVIGATTTDTVASPTGGPQTPGVTASDTATISLTAPATGGPPTGTVAFRLCGPNGCTVVDAAAPVSGGVAHSSSVSGAATDAVGQYCWEAVYTPSGFFSGSSDTLHPADECFTVVGATTTDTVATPTGGNQAPGVSAHDTATISLTAPATGGPPTGTVAFTLCGPNGCAQTDASAPVVNGVATSTTVSGSTTDHVGTYCWEAVYTPTGFFTGSSDTQHPADECFTVIGATTVTTASSKTGNQQPGVSVTDTATVHLTAPATGGPPTGSVTFTLCDPSSTCTQIGSPVTVNGSGQATSNAVNGTTTPNTLAIGTYCWQAVYTPTGFFSGSSETAMPSEECFSVGQQPSTTTTTIDNQTVDFGSNSSTVSDGANVALGFAPTAAQVSATGFTPGSVTFSLYGPSATASCTQGDLVLTVVRPSTYNPTTGVVSSSIGPLSLAAANITSSGTYWWVASYAGDTYNMSSHSTCGSEVINAVDAFITITPQTKVNEVGQAHTFTITLTAIPANTTPSNFSITPSLSPLTGLTHDTDTCGSNLAHVGNVATCMVTINSDTAGTYTLNASGSVTMGGIVVTRSTSGNSGPGGSGPATKHYVDASIAINPQSVVNEVGHAHTFTITLTAIPDDTGTPSGFSITPSVTPLTGLTQNTNTCNSLTVVSAAVRTCTVTINSSTAGTYTINASGSVTMGGVTVNRTTSPDGTAAGPGGSGPATKHYVDASISISPLNVVNEVGHAHTFTITLTAIPDDTGTPSGFSITPSVTPLTGLTQNDNTCGSLTTVSANVRTCTVTINSNTAGTYTINASGSVTMGGVTVNRTTSPDGSAAGPGGSGPATKHYVDASISITPIEATNVIKHQHVFTITLTAIPDDAGAPSNFSITPVINPTTNLTTNTNTCNSLTVVSANIRTCTYTINSSTAGTYVLNAMGSVTMGGVTVTRGTLTNPGPGGSGPATKHYIAPNSSLVKSEEDVTTPDLTQNGGGFAPGPITAHPLDVIEYRLIYTNSGQGAASQVTVTDVVPTAHSAYVAGSCTPTCTYKATTHTLTWELGTVAGGGTQVVMTFQIKLTNDFPVGVTTQITNAAVVTTFEEGSLPSNTVVANVFIPVQQVQAVTITLPKAGAGPQPARGFGGLPLNVGTFGAALLLTMMCVLVYETLRRTDEEKESQA